MVSNITKNKTEIKSFFNTFKFWPRMYNIIWNANKRYFLVIITLSILNGLFPATLILLLESLVNQISYHNNIKLVFSLLAAYIGLILLTSFLETLLDSIKSIYQEQLVKSVDMLIIGKSSVIPYEFFENYEVYDVIQRARNESTYRPFQIFEQTLGIITGLVTLSTVSLIIINWNFWVLFVLLIIPILSGYSFLKLGKSEYLVNYFQTTKKRFLYYITHLMTTDSNIREIQTFDKTYTMKLKYEETYNQIFKENKALVIKRFKTTILFDFLTIAIVGVVLIYLIYDAYKGLIAVGSLIAYIQSVNKTQSQSSITLRQCFDLYENNLFLNQLFTFLDLPESNIVNSTNTLEVDTEDGQLIFRNVSFRYPSRNKAALRKLDLAIKPGEIIALVGENGSGKSTLTKLICRLFNPSEGTITYNGRLIQDYSLKEWKNKISVVFQEFNRYEFSVKENITLGGTEYNDIDLKKAAEYSGGDEFINALPNKYDSQLGVWFEDGVQLSGGQWQKIAIARSFIKDAEIYVLDEPTSAIDGLSQEKVFNSFTEICKSKIGIFISHRLSNVIHADKIVVLKDGEIKDIGTHEQLVERCEIYNKLYNSQVSSYVK